MYRLDPKWTVGGELVTAWKITHTAGPAATATTPCARTSIRTPSACTTVDEVPECSCWRGPGGLARAPAAKQIDISGGFMLSTRLGITQQRREAGSDPGLLRFPVTYFRDAFYVTPFICTYRLILPLVRSYGERSTATRSPCRIRM